MPILSRRTSRLNHLQQIANVMRGVGGAAVFCDLFPAPVTGVVIKLGAVTVVIDYIRKVVGYVKIENLNYNTHDLRNRK